MESGEHTLEFLLAFDGRRHWYEAGYSVRFQIMRVAKTSERPHGLRYSFTLHNPKDAETLVNDFFYRGRARARGARSAIRCC